MVRSTAAAVIAASAAFASAEVVSVTITGGPAGATGQVIAPPAAVGDDNFNDLIVRAFDEVQNVRLSEDLVLDTQTVRAGTLISSHYIVWDPAGAARVQADILLDEMVLGVASTTGRLDASDFVGSPTTNYLNPGARGLEGGDTYSFSGETVSIDFSASSPGDAIRVITFAIPTPGTTVALAAMAGIARRRR